MKINIPTKITLIRIVGVFCLLVAFAVFYFAGLNGWVDQTIPGTNIYWTYLICCIVFILASATDALDGHLARKWNQVTTLGKFLDPIADKMLVNSMLVILAVPMAFAPNQLTIPWFCVVIMILRDLVVDTLRFVAASKNEVIAANIFGKLKTIFQMVAIPFVLLNGWPFSYFDGGWNPLLRIASFLVYIATAMSLISGIIYVIQNKHVLKEKKHGSDA